MSIHLDISQLVLDPRRSGIQRAERELIRQWPGPTRLVPCRFDPATGMMQELPADILGVLCEDLHPGGTVAELARLLPFLRHVRPAHPTRLLNAELFTDPLRASYYRRAPASCRTFWLIYDFLPWLYPDWFSVGSAAQLMPYLDTLHRIADLAFISAKTRDDYASRIVRRPAHGPVIPMGADGLGLERQQFDPARQKFVMLGTIERRKNAAPTMEAFKYLWRSGIDAQLVMIGAISAESTTELALLASMRGDCRFEHLRNLSDEGIRNVLRGARAMLFPSEGEGFGIPPMEALHAGIPVVISATLPAIAGLPALGQIRLDQISPESIGNAVVSLMDDDACRKQWQDAAGMSVSTWADFARGIADWVQA